MASLYHAVVIPHGTMHSTRPRYLKPCLAGSHRIVSSVHSAPKSSFSKPLSPTFPRQLPAVAASTPLKGQRNRAVPSFSQDLARLSLIALPAALVADRAIAVEVVRDALQTATSLNSIASVSDGELTAGPAAAAVDPMVGQLDPVTNGVVSVVFVIATVGLVVLTGGVSSAERRQLRN